MHFAMFHGRDVDSVTPEEVAASAAGIRGWVRFHPAQRVDLAYGMALSGYAVGS